MSSQVAQHYTTGNLLERIRQGPERAGVDPNHPRPADLKPVDEFHIGGAAATEDQLDHVTLTSGMAVLDIGSGIGGAARMIAERHDCHVTGLDLTDEFVETATALSAGCGLADRTTFRVGSALSMPFADESFDAALLLHVGMNIPDKSRLMAEAARVLRPGASFLVYEVMLTGDPDLQFPVPWAGDPANSFLAAPADYRGAARSAGFELVKERDRRDFALDFFRKVQARVAESGPPPLGIHLFMGDTARQKITNMIVNIEAGRIAPVEMILQLSAPPRA